MTDYTASVTAFRRGDLDMRVLVGRPELVLADEPVASLDPARAREVLTRLARPGGPGLVTSLHDAGLALAHLPRLVALRDGRVVFDAAPGTVPAATLDALYRTAREGA